MAEVRAREAGDRRVGAGDGERAHAPAAALLLRVGDVPVGLQRARERERLLVAAGFDRPAQRGPEVVALGPHQRILGRGLAARPQRAARALGQREVVRVVALARRLGGALGGVLVDRLEQVQAAARDGREALVDERVERREIGVGDRLGRGEVAATGGRAERGERLLLGRGEQFVAPVERRPQRALTGGQVAGAGAEQGERVVEPRRQAVRVEQPEPADGELDRQRQPAEAAADVADRGVVVDAGAARARAGGEQPDRRPPRPAARPGSDARRGRRAAGGWSPARAGRRARAAARSPARRPRPARGCRARSCRSARGRARPRRPPRARG